VAAMLKASDFRLLSVQVALFFNDGKSFSQSSFLANMLGKYIARYDGAVQALPFSDTDPQEIPRVLLQSKDGQWRLQATLNRVDSFWNTRDLSQDTAGIIDQCTEVVKYFAEATSNLQITRLALVLNRITQTEKAAQELIDRFCNDDSKRAPFNRSENFEIHNHKKYELKQTHYMVNSWVRCKSALVIQPIQARAVIIEQDINTPEDIESIFNLAKVEEFYQETQNEMNDILSIYFPEER